MKSVENEETKNSKLAVLGVALLSVYAVKKIVERVREERELAAFSRLAFAIDNNMNAAVDELVVQGEYERLALPYENGTIMTSRIRNSRYYEVKISQTLNHLGLHEQRDLTYQTNGMTGAFVQGTRTIDPTAPLEHTLTPHDGWKYSGNSMSGTDADFLAKVVDDVAQSLVPSTIR